MGRIRILTPLVLLILFIAGTAFMGPLLKPALASAQSPAPNATNCQSKPTFFGLLPWYQYLTTYSKTSPQLSQPVCEVCFNVFGNQQPTSNCKSSTASDISLILLAVVDDLLRVAGLVAIGMVLFSSVKFITSQGVPDEVAKARSSLINGIIGAAIALVAVVIVSFIGSALGG